MAEVIFLALIFGILLLVVWVITLREKVKFLVSQAEESTIFQAGQTRSKLAARDARESLLVNQYIKDMSSWIVSEVTPKNFATQKKKLDRLFSYIEKHGIRVGGIRKETHYISLQSAFEDELRKQAAREEQQRIKAKIREEQQREREIEKEVKRAEKEQALIKEALDRALALAQDQHSVEIEALRARLTEAEAKAQRAVSQAQLTRSGYVYVISNIGSFGEHVYKVGMTRRLEPLDRVKELGDASVPFPFDVHMMISSEDAPTLEYALHQGLSACRVNRVNFRKEFFRVSLEDIRALVEYYNGTVEYVAEPEALEYRQSVEMSEEDYAYLSEQLASQGDEEE